MLEEKNPLDFSIEKQNQFDVNFLNNNNLENEVYHPEFDLYSSQKFPQTLYPHYEENVPNYNYYIPHQTSSADNNILTHNKENVFTSVDNIYPSMFGLDSFWDITPASLSSGPSIQVNIAYQEYLHSMLVKIQENLDLMAALQKYLVKMKKVTTICSSSVSSVENDARKISYYCFKNSSWLSPASSHRALLAFKNISHRKSPHSNPWLSRDKALLTQMVMQQTRKKMLDDFLCKYRNRKQELASAHGVFIKEVLPLMSDSEKSSWQSKYAVISRMSISDAEYGFEDIDWNMIASTLIGRSAVDCEIMWNNRLNPNRNRQEWTKHEVQDLERISARYNCRNWLQITQELATNRNTSQVFIKFQRDINKNLCRSKWTHEEDELLVKAVQDYGEGNWTEVSACLDGRSGQQCLHRWHKTLDPSIRRGKWTATEDDFLRCAVELYGPQNWSTIQKYVPGRTDVQCRERWVNVLDPRLNAAPFTPEEDELLRQCVSLVGVGRWSTVSAMLGTRTDNQCWRRWKTLSGVYKRSIPPNDCTIKRKAPKKRTEKFLETFNELPKLNRDTGEFSHFPCVSTVQAFSKIKESLTGNIIAPKDHDLFEIKSSTEFKVLKKRFFALFTWPYILSLSNLSDSNATQNDS